MKFNDNVYVMGNYFSTDYTELKAYTELEIKIDFFKVIQEALKRTHLWKSEAEKATGLFKWQDCEGTTADGFYKMKRDQLYQSYTNRFSNIDKSFYINSTKFQKELDDYIDELQLGQYLEDLHPGASQLYTGT